MTTARFTAREPPRMSHNHESPLGSFETKGPVLPRSGFARPATPEGDHSPSDSDECAAWGGSTGTAASSKGGSQGTLRASLVSFVEEADEHEICQPELMINPEPSRWHSTTLFERQGSPESPSSSNGSRSWSSITLASSKLLESLSIGSDSTISSTRNPVGKFTTYRDIYHSGVPKEDRDLRGISKEDAQIEDLHRKGQHRKADKLRRLRKKVEVKDPVRSLDASSFFHKMSSLLVHAGSAR